MEPITREEYYLAKIAGTYKGKTPAPVTIEEYYLATMAGDYSGNTPQPVTRMQYYMAKVAGVWGGSIPAPVTRLEYYWAAIANGEGTVFPPVTREEHFLVLVADAYSVVLTVVTGNPALLENSKGNRGLESLTLYGKSTQEGTTGAQLFDVSNADVVQMYIANSGIGNIVDNYSVIIPIKPSTSYTISEKNHKIFRVAITEERPIESAPTLFKDTTSAYKNITTPNNLPNGNFLLIQLYGNFVNGAPDFSGLMINEGSTAKPWEPYTGGAPSPSPSYPQEIESAGQDGEIGVEVLGKNLIPFPYPLLGGTGTQIERNGVKYTVQSDGGIRCVGTPTAIDAIDLTDIRFSEISMNANTPTNGKIVLSGEKMVYDARNSKLFIYIELGQLGKPIDTVIYPQVEFGTVATEYEPYKPAQKLIVPTSGGLPGIPVSSGGNYTDEKGQQWVCDEVDFKKGVYVQRIGKKTITSKDAFFKSGLSTNDVNYFALNNIPVHIGTAGKKDVIMSNCFVAGIYQHFGTLGEIFLGSAQGNIVYFSVEAQKYPDTETFKQWAVENGLMFLYQLADIVETHLTAEELSAYKTLRTYSPTTTVINDADAWMSVGYAKMK
nr:MAG: hypothetical protein [Bacteriophage sp.]